MTTLAVGARSTLVAAEVSFSCRIQCGEKINEFESTSFSVSFLYLLPWRTPSPLPTLSCRIHR